MATKTAVKKYSLFPHGYDEVSLVDEGAAGSAHVAIIKRKAPNRGKGRAKSPKPRTTPPRPRDKGLLDLYNPDDPKKKPESKKKPRKNSKGKKHGQGKKTRSQKNPCATGTNSSGASKSGDNKKPSQREKNWKQERHQRKEKGGKGGGQFTQTSSDSKAAYGKGGTTKAKLDAKCKRRSKVTKSIDNWATETKILEMMER